MEPQSPSVDEFVSRMTTEYNRKVEQVVEENLTTEHYDSIGGAEKVIQTQFPSQAWREFYIGLFPPSRQITQIYERGDPYGRDRDIMVGLGKQIRDEIKHANIFSRIAGEFDVECDLTSWEAENYESQVALCQSATEWDAPQKVAAGFQCSSEIVAAVNSRNLAEYLEDEYPQIAQALHGIASDEGDHVHVGRLIMKRFTSPDEFDELEAIAQKKYEAVREVYENL